MGLATNFFSDSSVILPETTFFYVRGLIFLVGDGTSTIFTLDTTVVQYVLHIAVLNASDVGVTDWSVSYGVDTVTITFDSAPATDSRRVIIAYLPDETSTVNVVAS